MAIGVMSDPTSRLGAPSGISNDTCWTSQNSKEICFKPVSKWKLLRRVFNCTRIWRDVSREAKNLRVHYSVDLKFTEFTSVEVVNQSSKPSAMEPTLNVPTVPNNLADTNKQHHSCKSSQNSMQCLIPLVVLAQPEYRQQSVFAVVASWVVFLSFECDQCATDHVDWGGCETNLYLLGSSFESKNRCVSIVTLFQAASILLFQAAYFWLKFREALCSSSSGRKRKLSDEDDDSMRGVYARPIKDRDGNFKGHKYEPRFKPPRERNGRTVQSFQNLSLGSYSDRRDAEIVRQIAAFYYGMDSELVSLGDGGVFRIPAMAQLGLSGLEKAKWVAEKAKEVFELFFKRNNTTQCPQSDGGVDKDLNVGGEAIQVADPSSSTSLNFNQALSQQTEREEAFEQLSPMQGMAEFLLKDPEGFALGNTVECQQSEDASMDLAYCQLRPHFFANPDCSTPCNTTLHDQSLQSAGHFLSNGIEIESSESGAAISCKWGLDALTNEPGAPVHDSHYSEFPLNQTVLSPQQDVTPSQLLTSFCSKNCIADLLVKVVSLQQQQIKELEHEVERLKGASQLKCSCQ